MKKSELHNILVSIGLTNNEASVYLSGLKLGPTTALAIAGDAEMKRTTVYAIIESLQAKGLIHTQIKGLKKLFAVESPEKLHTILKMRQENFISLLPEFNALYNLEGNQTIIKHHLGVRNIKSLYHDILSDLKAHDEYCAITDISKWLNVDKEYFENFRQKRSKLYKVSTRTLLQNTKEAKIAKEKELIYNTKVKLLPENTFLTTNIIITKNRLVIQQLIEPFSAIVIENKEVIATQKEMFELLWNSLPPPRNRHIKSKVMKLQSNSQKMQKIPLYTEEDSHTIKIAKHD